MQLLATVHGSPDFLQLHRIGQHLCADMRLRLRLRLQCGVPHLIL
jgi:hypothetical protein